MPPATVYQTLLVVFAAVPRQSLRARSKWDSVPGPPGAGGPASAGRAANSGSPSDAATRATRAVRRGPSMRSIRPRGQAPRKDPPVARVDTRPLLPRHRLELDGDLRLARRHLPDPRPPGVSTAHGGPVQRLTTLTDEQRAAMPGHARRWIEVGWRTGEADWTAF